MDLPDFLHTDSDGEIRLKGHRIRLIDVAARYDEGHSAEGIVVDYYPTLSLSLVYKTIAFFLEHEDEVRQLIQANVDAMKSLEQSLRRTTPTLAELRNRMEVRRRAMLMAAAQERPSAQPSK